MKNTTTLTAFALASALLFTYCCKKAEPTDTYFYTNGSATGNKFKLFINDEYRGELPFINAGSNSDADSVRAKALLLIIKDKNYKVEAKDANETVIAGGLINMTMHGCNVKGSAGQVGVLKTTDIVVVDLAPEPNPETQN